jgi:hypothetical protein
MGLHNRVWVETPCPFCGKVEERDFEFYLGSVQEQELGVGETLIWYEGRYPRRFIDPKTGERRLRYEERLPRCAVVPESPPQGEYTSSGISECGHCGAFFWAFLAFDADHTLRAVYPTKEDLRWLHTRYCLGRSSEVAGGGRR